MNTLIEFSQVLFCHYDLLDMISYTLNIVPGVFNFEINEEKRKRVESGFVFGPIQFLAILLLCNRLNELLPSRTVSKNPLGRICIIVIDQAYNILLM